MRDLETVANLVEQIKQLENSVFYTLLNHQTEIVDFLTEFDFYSDYAKRFIKAIKALDGEINALTVYDKLKELKIAEESDYSRLIELQTTFAPIVGLKTVEVLKKYIKQYKAYQKIIELQQKVIESIEFSDEIDTKSILDEYTDFLNEQEQESDNYISNSEILQCIKNQDFEQKWLYKDFILTNSINVLDGRGGAKKSRFALQLAIHAVAQLDFLCFPFSNREIGVELKNAIYVTPSTENNQRLIAHLVFTICNYHNLDPAEILEHLIFVQKPQSLLQKTKGIEPTRFYHDLKRLSRQHKPDLIIIDPLARFMGVEFNNENIAIFYNYLEELDSTILLIHHQPKGDIGKAVDQTTALGGVLFRELARARFTLQGEKLMIEKNNLSKYFNHVVELKYDFQNCIFSTEQSEPYDIEFTKLFEKQKRKNGRKREEIEEVF